MIHHLTGGAWGLVIRRLLEAGTRTLPLRGAAASCPLAFGLPRDLPVGASPRPRHDAILQRKQPLPERAVLPRRAPPSTSWSGRLLAHFLNKWSLRAGPRTRHLRLARRLRSLSGGGLVLMGLTITFAAVDWAMSLDPHWFSTIYGMLFMVGQALSALALVHRAACALIGERAAAAARGRGRTSSTTSAS